MNTMIKFNKYFAKKQAIVIIIALIIKIPYFIKKAYLLFSLMFKIIEI